MTREPGTHMRPELVSDLKFDPVPSQTIRRIMNALKYGDGGCIGGRAFTTTEEARWRAMRKTT